MKNKKWLYTFLFVWVVAIDWLYTTQNGYHRTIAVNTLGILMGILTLKNYPYVKEKYRKPDICWQVLWLVGSVVGFFVWNRVNGPYTPLQYVTAAVAVGILGFTMIRVLFTGFWKKVNWRKEGIVGIAWGIMSLWIVLSRYYEIWQIWYFGMFLCFYLTEMEAQEENVMWDALANGIIIGFFALQIWAYGFRPYDEVRYLGPYSNTNMTALFYLITYAMVLYRIYVLRWKGKCGMASPKKWVNIFQKIFYYVLAGGLISFTFFTICRTALLVLVGMTVLVGIIADLWLLRDKARRLILRWAALTLCAIVTFPCVYGTIRYLPCILHRPVWFYAEYSESKVHSYEPWDSTKYISLEEFLEEAVARLGYGGGAVLDVEASGGPEEVAFAAAQEDLLRGEEAMDSGKIRLAIWKKYFGDLTWTGHTLEEGQVPITEDYHAWHAQNVFLQVLYYYGIPAGVLFILLMLWYGVRSLGILKNAKEPTVILPGMIFVIFVGFGMMECVWYSGQAVMILMYLLAKRLLRKPEKI